MAGHGSSVIRVRAARLSALLLLVSAAGWAAINLPGHTASMAATAATEYRWPVPDWMPPPPVPLDNPMSTAKAELGRRLFFDVRLAGLNYISCATCHRPELGFSDALGWRWGSPASGIPETARHWPMWPTCRR